MSQRDPRLDRRIQFDERSRSFPVRATLTAEQIRKPRSYTWSCGIQLDQGTEGACVGFSIAHEIAARPVVVKSADDALARQIYYRARQIDEWPGENYEGTSILAGVKAAQEAGYFGEYRWCFSLSDLALAVGYKGPALLGLNWYAGQLNTDANGFIHPTGYLLGGHAILCRAVSVKGKFFTLRNSWGNSWGVNGDCRITFDELDRLLHEQGEACVPVKRMKGNVSP